MKTGITHFFLALLLLSFACSCEKTRPSDQARGDDSVPSWTAFVKSCMEGDLETVQSALRAGIDPDKRYTAGSTTCMIQAAFSGHEEAVGVLLEAGANPDLKGEPGGVTALMIAAREGREKVVDVLLANGADPDLKFEGASTAIDFAEFNGHDSIVRKIESASASQP